MVDYMQMPSFFVLVLPGSEETIEKDSGNDQAFLCAIL